MKFKFSEIFEKSRESRDTRNLYFLYDITSKIALPENAATTMLFSADFSFRKILFQQKFINLPLGARQK